MTLINRLRITQSKHLYFLFIAFLLPIYVIPTFRKGVTWFHIINVFVLAGYLMTFILQGRRPRWYFLLPIWVYFVGSLLGMFNSQAIDTNLYTLGQDIYLYTWFVALCVIVTTQDDIDYLTVAWMFAAIMVIVLGTVGPSVLRAEFTFVNPNRAATYFMTAMGFMFAPVFARRPLVRIAMLLVLLWAIWRTASLGVLPSLAISTIIATTVVMYLRSGGFWAVRQVGLLILAGIIAYVSVAVYDVDTVLTEANPLSFGRAERSLGTREQVWRAGFETFREHPFGIGPASFLQQVEIGLGKSGSLELHSDHIAALVERGVVGLAGLILLQLMVAGALFRMVRLARRVRSSVQLWVAVLCGQLAGYFIYAITHETLHHDTLWLLLALVIVQSQILAREVRSQVAVPRQRAVGLAPVTSAGKP